MRIKSSRRSRFSKNPWWRTLNGEDEDDPHSNLTDKCHFKGGNNDKPLVYDWTSPCYYKPTDTPKPVTPSLDDYPWIKGVPELDDDIFDAFPLLSELCEEAEDIAEDHNADVIVNVLNRLNDSAIASDLRLAVLKEMPDTCEYRKVSRKILKWSNAVQSMEHRSKDDEIYDDNPFVNDKKSRAHRKIDRYKARIASDLKPCDSCFSCKANTVGTKDFLEKEIPQKVSQGLNELKGELFSFI